MRQSLLSRPWCPRVRSPTITPLGASCAVMLVGFFLACNDLPTNVLPPESRDLVISDTAGTTAGTAIRTELGRSAAITSASGAAYVSLPSGAVPDGMLALIHNKRTGDSAVAPMTDGGFDPVRVVAQPGDSLATLVLVQAGGASVTFANLVPPRRRPTVVRTIPARGKTGVPLNMRITVVFSEPIQAQSLSPAAIRLEDRSTSLSGQLSFADAEGLVVELTPDALLAANTTHRIIVTPEVRDLDGDLLESEVAVEFTTGTTVALASVSTDQPALFTTPDGEIRTFEMTAIEHGDRSFSGRFNIFFPATLTREGGSITCFRVGAAGSIWVAGVTDHTARPDNIGIHRGWRMVDNGPAGGPVPDMLSFTHPVGNGEQFCDLMPPTNPTNGDEIALLALEAGDIVVRGPGDGPPSDTNKLSLIAFTAQPAGGIRVMRADGTGTRTLTFAPDWDPSWSPDGKKIVFQRRESDGSNIYVINADGSGLKRLTNTGSDARPAWSPDGKRIAFDRDAQIHLMNADDGSGVVVLTQGERPVWSPDGSRIAFGSQRDGEKWGVSVMFADGSGIVRLTSDTMHAFRPAWSPDGRFIAFQVQEDLANADLDYRICVMNADGTDVRQVAILGHSAAWSPDSRRIIYWWLGLRVIKVDGSGMVGLANGFTPAWSPTGTMPTYPEPSVTMSIAGGNNQSDSVFTLLPEPLSVRLVRDDGSPATGVRVDWEILHDDLTRNTPSLSTRSATSDANGVASVRMWMGSVAGRWLVHAFLTDASAHNPELEFSAIAKPGTPVRVEPIDLGPAGPAFGVIDSTLTYAVLARDAHGSCLEPDCGNLVTGARIAWAVTSGGGSITPAEDTTAVGNSVHAPGLPASVAIHKLGSNEGQVVVTATAPITSAGVPEATFRSTIVTKLVRVGNATFSEGTVSIPSGKTVGWYWDDETAEHDLVFEDDPSIGAGKRGYGSWFTRTFSGVPRAIRYRCIQHSGNFDQGHVGVVNVTAP